MKACNNCGLEVSFKNRTCPHCGKSISILKLKKKERNYITGEMEKENNYISIIIFICVILLASLMIYVMKNNLHLSDLFKGVEKLLNSTSFRRISYGTLSVITFMGVFFSKTIKDNERLKKTLMFLGFTFITFSISGNTPRSMGFILVAGYTFLTSKSKKSKSS